MATPGSPVDTARDLARLAGAKHQRAAERARRLGHELPAAAHLLRAVYSAERVLLVGSLATGADRETGDVDIGVEGLAGERDFAALSDLMAIFGAPVDLARLEEAPQSLRERIAAEGEPS